MTAHRWSPAALALTVVLCGYATGRPPCAHTVPVAENACIQPLEEPCMDSWIVQNQLVWSELFIENPPFTLYDSFVYTASEEVETWGDYIVRNNTGLSAVLHVYDIVESSPADPNVAAIMCQEDMNAVIASKATAFVVLGELIRGQRDIGALGFAFNWDPAEGERQHRFVIVRTLPMDVTVYLRGYAESRARWLAGQGGCFPLPSPCIVPPPDDPHDCFDTSSCYRHWQMQTAEDLQVFNQCMKDLATPFGLPGLACVFGCAPAFLAGGVGYAGRLAACFGALGLANLVDASACEDALQWSSSNTLPLTVVAWSGNGRTAPRRTRKHRSATAPGLRARDQPTSGPAMIRCPAPHPT